LSNFTWVAKELIQYQVEKKEDIGDGIRQADEKFMYGGSTQKTYWSQTLTEDGRAKNGCAYISQGIFWLDPVDLNFGFYVRCIKKK
jgi:hypothetical protein